MFWSWLRSGCPLQIMLQCQGFALWGRPFYMTQTCQDLGSIPACRFTLNLITATLNLSTKALSYTRQSSCDGHAAGELSFMHATALSPLQTVC